MFPGCFPLKLPVFFGRILFCVLGLLALSPPRRRFFSRIASWVLGYSFARHLVGKMDILCSYPLLAKQRL